MISLWLQESFSKYFWFVCCCCSVFIFKFPLMITYEAVLLMLSAFFIIFLKKSFFIFPVKMGHIVHFDKCHKINIIKAPSRRKGSWLNSPLEGGRDQGCLKARLRNWKVCVSIKARLRAQHDPVHLFILFICLCCLCLFVCLFT